MGLTASPAGLAPGIEVGMSVLEFLRFVNVALGLVCLLLMWWQFPVWRTLPEAWRMVSLGLGALTFSTTAGTVETLLTGAPVGFRVPLTSIALAWLFYGLRRVHRVVPPEVP